MSLSEPQTTTDQIHHNGRYNHCERAVRIDEQPANGDAQGVMWEVHHGRSSPLEIQELRLPAKIHDSARARLPSCKGYSWPVPVEQNVI
jgi:hypothetical protein